MKRSRPRTELGRAFAYNLLHHRALMDLSQGALAARAGLSVAHVCMLERGQREPSFETVEHLAAALNVRSPHEMFTPIRRKP